MQKNQGVLAVAWERSRKVLRAILNVAGDVDAIEGLPSRLRRLAVGGVWLAGLIAGVAQWWLLLPSAWRIPVAVGVGLVAALVANGVVVGALKIRALRGVPKPGGSDAGSATLKEDWLDIWAGFGLGSAAPPGYPGHEDTALSVHLKIINRSADRRAYVRFMLSDSSGGNRLRPAEAWQFDGRHFPYTDPPLNLKLLFEPIAVGPQEEVSGYIWFFARDRFTMPLDRFGMFDSISTEEAWTALPAEFREAAQDRSRTYCRAVTCTPLGKVHVFDHEAVAPLLN